MGVLVTVLSPRPQGSLPRVGVLMMWIVVRMLMRVGKRLVLVGVGVRMIRHGDFLSIRIDRRPRLFVAHETLIRKVEGWVVLERYIVSPLWS